jgi:hypothetical protein
MFDYRLFFPNVPADEPPARRPFRRTPSTLRLEIHPPRVPATRRGGHLAGQA